MKKTLFISRAAAVAAMYIILTELSALAGMSSGAVQLRISEALTVLPAYTVSAVPGLTVGCLISNILTGGTVWDMTIGTLATLFGAVFTRLLSKHRYLAPVPPVIFNSIGVPAVICLSAGQWNMYFWYMLTVFIGEAVSCGLFGSLLNICIQKNRKLREIIEK